MSRELILASASPRRVHLLREAGFELTVLPPAVDELHDVSMTGDELTLVNARLKARAVAAIRPDATVLAADTLVCIDGEPLAKPADLDDARLMLARLSGRTHYVCTGVAITSDGRLEEFVVKTFVTFKDLSSADIETYLNKVHVLDKAGAYAIQEHGDIIIERIEGSRTNVIGLPMDEVIAALKTCGVRG
jgi:septum formation protein